MNKEQKNSPLLSSAAHWPKNVFPSLEHETRTAVDTEIAAFHLGRRPQTLRVWACYESGPIRPIRINGRLAWRVEDIKRVLGGA